MTCLHCDLFPKKKDPWDLKKKSIYYVQWPLGGTKTHDKNPSPNSQIYSRLKFRLKFSEVPTSVVDKMDRLALLPDQIHLHPDPYLVLETSSNGLVLKRPLPSLRHHEMYWGERSKTSMIGGHQLMTRSGPHKGIEGHTSTKAPLEMCQAAMPRRHTISLYLHKYCSDCFRLITLK